MPTYDYECDSCGRRFEVFQRMSDEPASPCPGCGNPARRIITAGIGISFQGDGFYVNDSAPARECVGKCPGCEKADG